MPKFVKCVKCELNYVPEGAKLCTVCARGAHGSLEEDTPEVCIECGERPPVAGEELCAVCLKEQMLTGALDDGAKIDDDLPIDAQDIVDDDDITELEELEIDDDDIPEEEMEVIEEDLDGGDDSDDDLDGGAQEEPDGREREYDEDELDEEDL